MQQDSRLSHLVLQNLVMGLDSGQLGKFRSVNQLLGEYRGGVDFPPLYRPTMLHHSAMSIGHLAKL